MCASARWECEVCEIFMRDIYASCEIAIMINIITIARARNEKRETRNEKRDSRRLGFCLLFCLFVYFLPYRLGHFVPCYLLLHCHSLRHEKWRITDICRKKLNKLYAEATLTGKSKDNPSIHSYVSNCFARKRTLCPLLTPRTPNHESNLSPSFIYLCRMRRSSQRHIR